jgi:amino acid transporter
VPRVLTREALTTAREPHLRRVLGLGDVVLMIIAGMLNLNTLTPLVAHGSLVLLAWPLTFVVWLVPQCITVIELSQHFPGEGAVYVWPTRLLGGVHGFLSGWCYAMANAVYVPTLIVSSIGLGAFAFMDPHSVIPNDGVAVEMASFGLLAMLIGLSIRGMVAEKWLVNFAAIGTLLAGGLLVALAVWLVRHDSSATQPIRLRPEQVDWHLLPAFSLTCYALLGFEIASNVGDEIRDPRRTLRRAVFIGAIVTASMYFILTLSTLITLPTGNEALVAGLMPAIAAVSERAGVSRLVPAIAVLLALSVAGAAAAWIASPARIPYVAALDGYLPRIFGRLHGRYQTPHIALLGTGVLCALALWMSFAGATLNEAFLTILDLAVILSLAQYLYMYSSLLSLVFRHRHLKTMLGRRTLIVAGIGGLMTTLFATVFAFVPGRGVEHVWMFELKLWVACLLMIGVGVTCFRVSAARRAALSSPAAGGLRGSTNG